MHAMIIVPALIEVFDTLKTDKNELYNYSDCKWFNSLKKACKDNLQIEINEQTLTNLNSYEIAQKLIDFPIAKAFDYLSNGDIDYEN